MIKTNLDDIFFNYERCPVTDDIILTYYSSYESIFTFKSSPCADYPRKFISDVDLDMFDGYIINVIVTFTNIIILTNTNKLYICKSKTEVKNITPEIPIIDIFIILQEIYCWHLTLKIIYGVTRIKPHQ